MPEIDSTARDRSHIVAAILMLAMCLMAFPVVAAVAGEPVMTGQAAVDSNPSELDLVLLGTVLHDPGKPMAIIQDGETGEQKLYWLGDVVEGGRLTKILRDSVTLTFAENEVELGLTGGARGTPATAATVTGLVQPPLSQTDGAFWRVERHTLHDLSRARELSAHVTSLGVRGVRVDKVQADGFFHKLGLQQGDIIHNINGRVPGAELSLQQAIEQKEMGETMLRLEIDRQGRMNFLYYEFDP